MAKYHAALDNEYLCVGSVTAQHYVVYPKIKKKSIQKVKVSSVCLCGVRRVDHFGISQKQ